MNGIIIVNKPQGFTSHDVVAKLRGIFKTRRIGHSGTLDPMATGVLPVFIGRATRACEFATEHDKVYRAEILLGTKTDTQDITGSVLSTREVSISDAQLLGAAASQVGEIDQLPPMYSAVKIGGKKLYQLAREGAEVERTPRRITVYSIAVKRISDCRAILTIHASKGTYIRTICNDIGDLLGCGACLTSLCRVSSGGFNLSDAHDLSEIEQEKEALVRPVDSLFAEYPSISVNAPSAKKVRNGAQVECDAPLGATMRVYDENGDFLMIAKVVSHGDRRFLKTIKSFFEV